VWSTAWIRDQERELDAIEHAIEVARAAGSVEADRVEDQEDTGADDEEPLWAVPVMQSPPNQGHLFDEYRTARLPRANGWEELRYAPPERLRSLILQVIETEGPVHPDLVVVRLRDAFGQQRAGRPSQEAVEAGIERVLRSGEAVETSDGFLKRADLGPVLPRRAASRRTARAIRHISDEEVIEGLLRVSRTLGKMTLHDLMTQTRREFGFDRTGAEIEQALARALEQLVNNNALQRDGNGQVWAVQSR